MPLEFLTDQVQDVVRWLSDKSDSREKEQIDYKGSHQEFVANVQIHAEEIPDAEDVVFESASERAVNEAQNMIADIQGRFEEELAAERNSDDDEDEDEDEEDELTQEEMRLEGEIIGDGEDLAGEKAEGQDGGEARSIADGSDLNALDSEQFELAPMGTTSAGPSSFLAGKGWLIAAFTAVGGGALAFGTQSSSSSAEAGEPGSVTPGNTINGSVVLGPVTGGVSVTVYANDGTEIGTADVDGNGSYSIDVGDYTGSVLLQIADTNAGASNYVDEATGEGADLTVALRAVSVVEGAVTIVNITPLTEVAVREAGLASTNETNLSNGGANASDIQIINRGIAKLFLGDGSVGIEASDVKPVIDANGNDTSSSANTYGKVLAALSGAD
ncbi:MAG: hypothetical protein JKY94_01715, partial [Rhodobacteraceae bacterium]|nr:hypothetical protein [Paracoccaceae bacterium]